MTLFRKEMGAVEDLQLHLNLRIPVLQPAPTHGMLFMKYRHVEEGPTGRGSIPLPVSAA